MNIDRLRSVSSNQSRLARIKPLLDNSHPGRLCPGQGDQRHVETVVLSGRTVMF